MARGGPSRTLKLTYVGDASSLTKANQQAESGLEKLGVGFAKVGKAVAVGVAAVGAGILAFAKVSIDSAIEAEAAQNRLATILTNTGNAADGQVQALNRQAEALERVGVASAGNITTLQAQLATFDLSAATIETLTPAIIDYVIAEKGATASAGDFQSAANGLAQALSGNFASLTATGFVLDDVTRELISNGTEAERAAALVAILESTYAGFNEAARETTEGQLQALKNGFDGLKETIGGALLPVFNDLVGGADVLVGKLRELWEIHGPNIIERFTRIRDRAIEIFTQFKERLPEAIDALRERLDPLIESVTNLGTAFANLFRETFRELRERKSFDGIRQAAGELKEQFDITLTSFNNLLNVISGGDVERSGGIFARVIELQYLKPIQKLIELIEELARIADAVFNAIARQIEAFRGAREGTLQFDLDTGFEGLAGVGPGATRGAQGPTINLTVEGASDPELAARTIVRTLNNSSLRLGAPTRELVGVVI
jgi:hypothetical protein